VTDPSDYMEDMDDDGGLYVNFSEEEAASESRDIEPLPTGKYLMTITDVNLRECGPGKQEPWQAILRHRVHRRRRQEGWTVRQP